MASPLRSGNSESVVVLGLNLLFLPLFEKFVLHTSRDCRFKESLQDVLVLRSHSICTGEDPTPSVEPFL